MDRSPLPKQRTWVWSLVREDATCCGATKAYGQQILSLCSRACEPQLLKTRRLELVQQRFYYNEKPEYCNEEYPTLTTTRKPPYSKGDPVQPKIINNNKKEIGASGCV